ncbi:MAG: cob(I)yrinic acid a,c-diamide adenosyltransferase [Phycisphaerae bacterium]|nr:cob(I)yrinic acid a,c-diamide adenosyltransferase [Phycisphaerae bacterium]
MTLYTRTGDEGETSLLNGQRVRKDDPRVIACGAVDETNAVLGWAAVALDEPGFVARLRAVQSDLFCVGAELAALRLPAERKLDSFALPAEAVARLEHWIDETTATIEPATTFVLPGGSELAGRLHIARTVCRRAERDVAAILADDGHVPSNVSAYLNRLSDLLFTWAQWANQRQNVQDVPWRAPGRQPPTRDNTDAT